jgi:hypothetical protein
MGTNYCTKDNTAKRTTTVAGAHKTTGATSRGYKETRKLTHRPNKCRKDFKKLRNFKKAFKQKTCKQNFSELTEVNYSVAW